MDIQEIVAQIDAQISQLQKARTLLSGTAPPVKRKPGHPAGSAKVIPAGKANGLGAEKIANKPSAARTLTAESRERISAAQKARWAKYKAASKKAVKKDLRKAAATPAARSIKPKAVAPKTAPVKKVVSVQKASTRKADTAAVVAA